MKKYLPVDFEAKWQKKWAEDNLYGSDLEKSKKHYVLAEFTYPSGDLHMGHWFTFAGADFYARLKRMQGYQVFFPNGFDAFGLPAENAAIKRGVHPQDWTLSNIERMKTQFASMGASFTFDHEVITCLPIYYKWNQWIFLKMLEKGLAYRGKYLSNWCNICQTVLANEAVEGGACWRCGTEVVQKEIDQWFFRITDYAERLIWKDKSEVDWPKAVKDAQNNWIGRSEGVLIKFDDIVVLTTRPDTLFGATFIIVSPEHPLLNDLTVPEKRKEVEEYVKQAKKKSELERKENKEKTGVFTGSYVKNPINGEKIPVWVADYVLAGYGTGAIMAVPAHDQRDFEFAKKYGLEIKPVVLPQRVYVGDGRKYFKRRVEIHRNLLKQISKHAHENQKQLMIWGGWAVGLQTGSEFREFEDLDLMILEEDLNWWKDYAKSLGLKIHQGIYEGKKDAYYFSAVGDDMWVDFNAIKVKKDGKVSWSNGGEQFSLPFNILFEEKTFEGISVLTMAKQALYEIKKEHITKGKEIRWKEQADFVMMQFEPYEGSGALINSNDFNGLSSEEAKDKITKYLTEHQLGEKATYYHLHDWSISRQRYWGTPIPIIHCPKCGIVPVPEKDLPVGLPYDVDYAPKGKPPLASNDSWLNVKCPKCEGEAKRDSETMDTFVDSSWYFFRYLDPKNEQQIFDTSVAKKMMPVDIYFGGAEHTLGHTLYARFLTKFFHDLNLTDLEEFAGKRINHGIVLGPDGYKMSKSRGNVVNPDEEVKKYGADTIRVYLGFFMPYEATGPWVPERIWGAYRFLDRVWGLQEKVSSIKYQVSSIDLIMMHNTIKKVTEDIENIKYNTAIAALMEWLNYLSKKDQVGKEEYQTLLLLLAPFAPHMTEELYQYISGSVDQSIHQQSWPKYDEKYLEEEEATIVVTINGKVRDQIVIQKDMAGDSKVVEKLALQSPKVQKFVAGKKIKDIVYVPVKIINFVLASD